MRRGDTDGRGAVRILSLLFWSVAAWAGMGAPALAQPGGGTPAPGAPSTTPAIAAAHAVHSSWPAREERRGELAVRVGPIRIVMRAARSPLVSSFADGTVLLFAGSKLGAQTVRSEDAGQTWRIQKNPIGHLNTLALDAERLLVLEYNPKPIPDQAGRYRTKRWVSADRGRSLPEAEEALLSLPVETINPKLVCWFHGNLVRLDDGDLLTVMQGEEGVSPTSWRTFLVRSRDEGKTWQYVSMLADRHNLAPIKPQLTATGFRIHGSVEPTLVSLGNRRLVCITRTVDDESKIPESQYGPASDSYHDLSYTIPGDGIHKSMSTLPADRFYTPGPPSAPLVILYSEDEGQTWTKPAPMRQARGCFPRTALSADGILALSYGGLGVPRWGNCISFSLDGGKTWTDEINFGPFLTTGYTNLVCTGEGKFLAFFDCTPPQPWTNDAAWWVGAVDIEVRRTTP